MRQRAKDLAFWISLINAGGMEIDNCFMGIIVESKPTLEKEISELEYLEKAIKTLDTLHIYEDISIESMTDTDFRELETLVRAFYDKQLIAMTNKNLPLAFVASVSNFRIALIHREKNTPENMTKLHDYFADDFAFGFSLSGESDAIRHFVPSYATLDKKLWSNLSNIRYEDVVPSFSRTLKMHDDKTLYNIATNTLITILLAYDETKKESLLSTAEQLSEWLLTNCTDASVSQHTLLLNYLQSVKRSRKLVNEERRALLEIIRDANIDQQSLIAAHILLDNQEAANMYFEQLDPASKCAFCKWPIYHFWNKESSCEES